MLKIVQNCVSIKTLKSIDTTSIQMVRGWINGNYRKDRDLYDACYNLSNETKEAEYIVENYAEDGFVERFCIQKKTKDLVSELRISRKHN